MEEEYKEAVRRFFEIYRPLQKKYNLRYHTHFSIYEDGLIEIWKYKGETRERLILRITEPEDVDCYKRAIEGLENFKREREERENGRNSVMAT